MWASAGLRGLPLSAAVGFQELIFQQKVETVRIFRLRSEIVLASILLSCMSHTNLIESKWV